MIWYDMIWSDIMGERWDERKKERQKGEEEDRSEIERKRWRLWHELADDSDATSPMTRMCYQWAKTLTPPPGRSPSTARYPEAEGQGLHILMI
jgi:hypothetical protein